MTAYLSAVPAVRFALFILLLCFAAGAQANLTLLFPYAPVTGRPDLVLTLCLLPALLSDAAGGCGWGFGAGLVSAALTGQTVGSLLVSRTVAGYVAGGFGERFVRSHPVVIVGAIAAASLTADAVYLLCNPPMSLAALLSGALGAGMNALWNAALALPLAHLLRRLGWTGSDDD
ncbi:MAG: hypothetical protein H7Y38_10400 [Armatimonadetes bacterium]|nr:hypothetical protein [Armatimonadota bacterium]